MTRVGLLACALVLTGALVLPAAGATSKASLRVAARAPLVLTGASFKQSESVNLVVLTGYGPVRRRVVAKGGRFSATFRGVPTTGCGAAYAARATGAAGSTATVVFRRAPICLPPPAP